MRSCALQACRLCQRCHFFVDGKYFETINVQAGEHTTCSHNMQTW